ncbi:LAGLIDADG family homing endonuclease [Candidatus Daviesbacteria bacterium]|nr:LAGLIDADG family homing endonuclease [Candidatus Daviesbacteria bacterium]
MTLNKRSQQIHSTSLSEGREKPKSLSEDYIVGLTDGEGCFYVEVRPASITHEPRIEMHFYIKMREDELPLLQKVQEFFDCGGVYFQKEYRVNQRNCYRFGVTAQKDLHEKIIPFFDKHSLKSQKLKNYLLFKQVALMVKNNEHRIEEGLEKIRLLKSQMNNGARWMRESRLSSGNSK